MAVVLLEAWGWLLLAAGVGLAAGWMMGARQRDRVRNRYRTKLHQATRNWEYVENRLALALDEVHAVRAELADCRTRQAVAATLANSDVGKPGHTDLRHDPTRRGGDAERW